MDKRNEQTDAPKSSKDIKAKARQDRLRAQLRANLGKRKAQRRAQGRTGLADTSGADKVVDKTITVDKG